MIRQALFFLTERVVLERNLCRNLSDHQMAVTLWDQTPRFLLPGRDRDLVWGAVEEVIHHVRTARSDRHGEPPALDLVKKPVNPLLILTSIADHTEHGAVLRNAIVDLSLAALLGSKAAHPDLQRILGLVGHALARLVLRTVAFEGDGIADIVARISLRDESFLPVGHFVVHQEGDAVVYAKETVDYFHGAGMVCDYVSVGPFEHLESADCCVVMAGKSVVPVTDKTAHYVARHYGHVVAKAIRLRKDSQWNAAASALYKEIEARTHVYRDRAGSVPEQHRAWLLELGAAVSSSRAWAVKQTNRADQSNAVVALGKPTSEPYVIDVRALPPCAAKLFIKASLGQCHWNDSARLFVGLLLRETVPKDRRADALLHLMSLYEPAIQTYPERFRVGERRRFEDEMARLMLRDGQLTHPVSCKFMREHNNGAMYGSLCAVSDALAGQPKDIEDLVKLVVPDAETAAAQNRWRIGAVEAVRQIKGGVRAGSKAAPFVSQMCCAALMHRVAAGANGKPLILSPAQHNFRLARPSDYRPHVPVSFDMEA